VLAICEANIRRGPEITDTKNATKLATTSLNESSFSQRYLDSLAEF